MASTSSGNSDSTKTRLQDASEKRRVQDELKRQEENKRQKKMFTPREVNEPRDIPVNSNISDIKQEDEVSGSSLVKQETLDAESAAIEPHEGFIIADSLEIKPEVENSLIVKVEETLDLESTVTEEFCELSDPIEQNKNRDNEPNAERKVFSSRPEHNDNFAEATQSTEDDEVPTNDIEFDQQKEEQIRALMEMLEGLQMRLNNLENCFSRPTLKNDENNSDGVIPNLPGSTLSRSLDNKQIIAELISNLPGQDTKINTLSCKILKLQNQIFANLEGQSSKKGLPVLYPELQLDVNLGSRSACTRWQTAVTKYSVEMGDIPTWKGPPLQKLSKEYHFFGLSVLSAFSRKKNIAGSTVFLDNVSIQNGSSVKIVKSFFNAFGNQIEYLKIRQRVGLSLPEFKIKKIMDYVKFILERLPTLKGFTLLISAGNFDQTDGPNCWGKGVGNSTFLALRNYLWPKLAKLEFLVIKFENFSDSFFLNMFASSLIHSYSEQLKQLHILALHFWEIVLLGNSCLRLISPNLVQLSIHHGVLSKVELQCENVEKCTIINHPMEFKHDDVILIQGVFPKLKCLGFNFDRDWNLIFHDFLWTTSTPKLPGVLTLELENCCGVTFTVLSCFPNLRYLKLINISQNEFRDSQDDNTALYIKTIFQGKNLYELQQFWENFPNISLVTLEWSIWEEKKMFASKLYTYTRDGYVEYCANNTRWCKN